MVALALDGQQMPAPFASYLPDAVSVGSLSKPFWGGLRIGWLRVPTDRMDAFFRARLSLDLGAPLLEQLVATDLLGDGGRPARAPSRASCAPPATPPWPRSRSTCPTGGWRRPTGGLNLWCELPEAMSSALVAARRAATTYSSRPVPSFAPEGGLDRFLRIPYTQPAHVLTEAIARLADAWRETLADPGQRRRARTTSLVA